MTDYNPPNRWIWQQPDWPNFTWQAEAVQPLLAKAHRSIGLLLGRAGNVDLGLGAGAALDALLQNIITSSAIEGENLNAASFA